MARSNVLIKTKSLLTREELADLLEELAAKIREGQATLSGAGGGVQLGLPEALQVDVQVKDSAKPSKIKRELEIEIEWVVDAVGNPVQEPGTPRGLTIS